MNQIEIDNWRKKDKAIKECRTYFGEKALKYQLDMYHKDISGWLGDVAGKHGLDNLKAMIAATIRYRDDDGRISRYSREWANNYNFQLPPKELRISEDEMFRYYTPHSLHSAVVDAIVSRFCELEKSNIKIVTVEPLGQPDVLLVRNKLEDLQKIVGGDIEVVCFDKDPSICLVCNESGKLLSLKQNRQVNGDNIVGTFFITKVGDDGEFISLSDAETEKFVSRFRHAEQSSSRDADALQKWVSENKAVVDCQKYCIEIYPKYQIGKNHLDFEGFIDDAKEKHGMETLKTVLAASILTRYGDFRIEPSTRAWARTCNFPEPPPSITESTKEIIRKLQFTKIDSNDLDILARRVIERENNQLSPADEAKRVALNNKLDDEHERFKQEVLQGTPKTVLERASEVVYVAKVYEYLTTKREFSKTDVDLLLDHRINILQSFCDTGTKHSEADFSVAFGDYLKELRTESFEQEDVIAVRDMEMEL